MFDFRLAPEALEDAPAHGFDEQLGTEVHVAGLHHAANDGPVRCTLELTFTLTQTHTHTKPNIMCHS